MTFWMTSQYMKQMRQELQELPPPPPPGCSQPPRGSEDPGLSPLAGPLLRSVLLCARSVGSGGREVWGATLPGGRCRVCSAVESPGREWEESQSQE